MQGHLDDIREYFNCILEYFYILLNQRFPRISFLHDLFFYANNFDSKRQKFAGLLQSFKWDGSLSILFSFGKPHGF